MGGKRAVAKITPPWPPLRRRRGNEPTLCPLQAVVGAVVFPHSASDQTWAENFFFLVPSRRCLGFGAYFVLRIVLLPFPRCCGGEVAEMR